MFLGLAQRGDEDDDRRDEKRRGDDKQCCPHRTPFRTPDRADQRWS
jgi:hypothetical protein